MARLRKLNIFDISKILDSPKDYYELDLNSLNSSVISKKDFLNSFWNIFLPMPFKKFPYIYVAIQEGEIIGAIVLIQDGKKTKRWKIARVITAVDNFEASLNLIEFAVHHFGAKGIETFLTYVDYSYENLLDVFQNHCNFRRCLDMEIWEVPKLITGNEVECFQPFSRKYTKDTLEFINSDIDPYYRQSLMFKSLEYRPGLKSREYIGFNDKEKIETFFTLSTFDNEIFWIDVYLNYFSRDIFQHIIIFVNNMLAKENENFKLYLKLKKYNKTSKEIRGFIEENSFTLTQTKAVFIKDYWHQIKKRDKLFEKTRVFNDMSSAACKEVNNQC